MRETLYIRLRSTAPEAVTAYCIAPANALRSFHAQEAPLAEVLALAGTRRIVLLVPGADVRLAQVKVPARAPAKVLQAAPYLLEEQLAEDVDTLHFALGPRQADGQFPVAVAARERVEAWLAPLRERHLTPEAIYPETLCLPEPDTAHWSALAEEDHVTVRTQRYAGFACAPDDLPLLLELSAAPAQTTLRILVARGVERDLSRLSRPVELLPAYNTALEALLQNLDASSAINLLQGAYSPRQNIQRLWLPWRAAAALALAWLLAAGTTHAVAAMKLGKELDKQNDLNLQRFKQLFPAEQRIVDLDAQVEQQSRLLKGGAHKGGFLPLLQTLTSALATTQGLNVQGLQFREGALYASLGGSDLQQLETLRSWFAQHHDAALEVQSANSGAEGVQIRLKLTPA
ncbi:MAG TPA: type II secretion system protein GspL [Nevskiaceae bacterium]|nr:type II secretion system protein GspL [Nevskiaceae bacterium]